jgi:hypothetical protein
MTLSPISVVGLMNSCMLDLIVEHGRILAKQDLSARRLDWAPRGKAAACAA